MVQKQQIKHPDLKQEMDYWVKDFEKKIQRTSEAEVLISENKQNIDHNYELIQDLQRQINTQKKEIKQLKHHNLVAMKSRQLNEIKY